MSEREVDMLERWRLILGREAVEKGAIRLSDRAAGMDAALEMLYDADRKGGFGASSPQLHRWLGDIRRYFPTPVVQLLQRDAIERLGLVQLLAEPEVLESLTPDVHLAATLLSLRDAMPEHTLHTARQVVRHIADELEQRLGPALRDAVERAMRRSSRTQKPRPRDIDWPRTVYRNLRHYQPENQRLIPQRRYGFARRSKALRHIVLAIDQSGSMADSLVYAAIFGAALASVRSLQTHLFVFDTEIADLSEYLHDPVELLFGTHLGGGTDIAKALGYAQTLIRQPDDTVLVLISDLYEGGVPGELLKKVHALCAQGVQLIVLLALSDEGAPAHDRAQARALAALDIPVFACTPHHFPDLMAAAIQRQDLRHWSTSL